MKERFADVGRGITLCFDEIGDPGATPLLLIPGLGQQLISWPEQLCGSLAGLGFRVIRLDNRDSGHSTHIKAKPPGPLAMMTGRFPPTTYNLRDMARDTEGLLDALGIERAHLVGASMGGMIAQVVASRYPQRVRSLTSMFSTTGAPKIGRPALSTWIKMASAPTAHVAEDAAKAELRMFRHIGSHGFGFDAQGVAEQAVAAWGRDPTSGGVSRQLAAILASGDRTAELAGVTAPTLVVHGDRDRMVATSGGLATHRAIPHSTLWIVPGMGHDYPRALWTDFTQRIGTHAADADTDRPGSNDAPHARARRPRKRTESVAKAGGTSNISEGA
ncbi:alpha/beta hydrolase [Streptomyces spongiae]|uniref:Alpha/beta hydrolase n=1 Tax=Streptomyces spongiae TaxID=565072 RepID=A0A5N8XAS1_9ACTN|nr:alpha/beta hydrolase [Streptomyces spongiae]